MLRIFVLVLLMFLYGYSEAQIITPIADSNLTVNFTDPSGSHDYKLYVPVDYFTCDSTKLYLMVFFGGDGETTASLTENQAMGNLIKYGGRWRETDIGGGRLVLNNGDTARWCILSVPNYGTLWDIYSPAIKKTVQSLTRLDITDTSKFMFGGLSGGPNRSINWRNNDTTTVSGLFKKAIFLSSSPYSLSGTWYQQGTWFIGWDRDDPNPGTHPQWSEFLYSDLSNAGAIHIDSLSTNFACHCSTVWDFFFDTTGLSVADGGTAETNRIRFLTDPNDGEAEPPTNFPKITGIVWRDIWNPVGTINIQGWDFFNENGADPRNGINTPTPSAVGYPTTQKFYPFYENGEYRFIVDLRGHFDLDKVYLYMATTDGEGAIRFYKGTRQEISKGLGTMFKEFTFSVGESGWKGFDLNDTVRYLMVGLQGVDYTSEFGLWSSEKLREIILYGELLGSRESAGTPYVGDPPRPLKMVDELSGTNLVIGWPTHVSWLGERNAVRVGASLIYFDDDTSEFVAGETVVFNFNHNFNDVDPSDGWDLDQGPPLEPSQTTKWDSVVNFTRLLAGPDRDHIVWQYLNGANGRAMKQGEGMLGFATNEHGQDPINASNYTRLSNFWWNYAAMYGGVEIDTNLIMSRNNPGGLRFSGKDIMNIVEIDNEPTLPFTASDTATTTSQRYRWPRIVSTMINMAWDGLETEDLYMGVKNADPSIEMVQPATWQPDSAEILSIFKLTQMMRDDSTQPLKWVNIHWYPTKELDGVQKGMHPVEAQYAERIQQMCNFAYSMDPNLKVALTEVDFSSAPGSSYYIVVSDSMYTYRQRQANFNLMVDAEVSRTSIDLHNSYLFQWNSVEGDGGAFNSHQEGKSFPIDTLMAVHYLRNSFYELLRGYRFDSVMYRSYPGLYVLRYKKVDDPDSCKLFVAYADTVEVVHEDQVIDLGVDISSVTRYELPYDENGVTSSILPVSSSTITVDAVLKPFIIAYSTHEIQPPMNDTIRRKRGQRWNIISN